MARYLVTGGAGFIGSTLVRTLLAEGAAVTVLDDFSTGRRSNLAGLERDITLVEGSLLDDAALERAMQDADYVLHLAAIASVPRSFDDPVLTSRVNSEGTLRVLLAARGHGVRRVVLASSSAVYGEGPEQPKHEELRPEPISPYALSKLDGEHYAAIFTRQLGLEVVALRYFNVFGPRQDPNSQYSAAIPRFVSRLLAGQPPVVYGDGRQTRDFCYVENVARANLLACTAPGAAGQVFNIAAGECIELLGLLDLLNRLLGTQLPPEFAAPRPGDIRHSSASIVRARALLGYQPAIDFAEGLRRTVDWYRSAPRTG